MVTGEPGTDVKVRRCCSAGKDAKKLKISPHDRGQVGEDRRAGRALVDLNLTSKARKAIDKHLPALKVTSRPPPAPSQATASGTLTR